jgi:hypothetical protein
MATALSLSYDPAVSSLIVYKKDFTEDKPGAVVNGDPRYGLSYEFSLSSLTEFHIWVKFLPDVPESQLAISQELTVYVTDLATLVTHTHQLLVPKTSTGAVVRAQLTSSGLAPDDPNLRLYRTVTGTPDRVIQPDDIIALATQVLAAVVPSLDDGQVLLRGAHVTKEGGYFRRIPAPFLAIVDASETVPRLIERVRVGLALGAKEWKRLKLMIGEQYATPSRGTLLKGDDVIQVATLTAQITGDPYLFVIHHHARAFSEDP